MPAGWKATCLGNLILLLSGRDLPYSKYSDTDTIGIPYITGASNFKDFKVTTIRYTQYPSVYSKKGDILITVKGTIGALALNPYEKAHIARQIMSIRPLQCDSNFLLYYLIFSVYRLKNLSNGIIPGISREALLRLPIIIPSKKEQLRISNILNETALVIKKLS